MLDINTKLINTEEKLILNIVRSLISPEVDNEIENILKMYKDDINWQRFIKIASHNQIVSLAYIKLKDKCELLPKDIYDILNKDYTVNLCTNMLLWNEFLNITRAFNENNIHFVPLKGISFIGNVYPDIGYRKMLDIDILVKDEHLKMAEKMLLGMGYVKYLAGLKEEYWREESCHIAFTKKVGVYPVLVELHWDLDIERSKNSHLPEIWSRTQEKELDGCKIRFLSVEDTIINLALHKRRSVNNLILKEVCDLAYIMNKFKTVIDWGYIFKYSRISRMQSSICFILLQATLIFYDSTLLDILGGLDVSFWKKMAMKRLILKNTFSDDLNFQHSKNIFLKSHFLLYDSFWESINYILNIPKEQFANFYNLKPYEKETDSLYKNRLLYISSRVFVDYFRNIKKKYSCHH